MKLCLRITFFVMTGPIFQGCSSSCMSQEQGRINDASGLTFIITETNCDTLGNSTATNIETYEGSNSKTTLFKYGPDERSDMPRITVQGNTIEIALDSVAEVVQQESRYKAYDVIYKIGRIVYPHNQAVGDFP